jgi:hypothetical protein
MSNVRDRYEIAHPLKYANPIEAGLMPSRPDARPLVSVLAGFFAVVGIFSSGGAVAVFILRGDKRLLAIAMITFAIGEFFSRVALTGRARAIRKGIFRQVVSDALWVAIRVTVMTLLMLVGAVLESVR